MPLRGHLKKQPAPLVSKGAGCFMQAALNSKKQSALPLPMKSDSRIPPTPLKYQTRYPRKAPPQRFQQAQLAQAEGRGTHAVFSWPIPFSGYLKTPLQRNEKVQAAFKAV